MRMRCGSCNELMDGYTPLELEAIGWRWHPYGKSLSYFIMCEACEERFAARRVAKDAASS